MFASRQHKSLQDQSSTANVSSHLSDLAFFGVSEVNIFLWGESRRIWSQDECISLSRASSSSVPLSLPPARFRLLCQSIIAHKLFDYVVLAFIFLNCITVALERPKILQGSLVRMCPPPFPPYLLTFCCPLGTYKMYSISHRDHSLHWSDVRAENLGKYFICLLAFCKQSDI